MIPVVPVPFKTQTIRTCSEKMPYFQIAWSTDSAYRKYVGLMIKILNKTHPPVTIVPISQNRIAEIVDKTPKRDKDGFVIPAAH
jgi:hypothetical protein